MHYNARIQYAQQQSIKKQKHKANYKRNMDKKYLGLMKKKMKLRKYMLKQVESRTIIKYQTTNLMYIQYKK